MPTTKQLWARQRNWEKGLLMAMRVQLQDFRTLTPRERLDADLLLSTLNNLINCWKERNEHSKFYYLKWRKTKGENTTT